MPNNKQQILPVVLYRNFSTSPINKELMKKFLNPNGDPDPDQNLIISSWAHFEPPQKIS